MTKTADDARRRMHAAQDVEEPWWYDPSEEYLRELEISVQDWLDQIRQMRRTITRGE